MGRSVDSDTSLPMVSSADSASDFPLAVFELEGSEDNTRISKKKKKKTRLSGMRRKHADVSPISFEANPIAGGMGKSVDFTKSTDFTRSVDLGENLDTIKESNTPRAAAGSALKLPTATGSSSNHVPVAATPPRAPKGSSKLKANPPKRLADTGANCNKFSFDTQQPTQSAGKKTLEDIFNEIVTKTIVTLWIAESSTS